MRHSDRRLRSCLRRPAGAAGGLARLTGAFDLIEEIGGDDLLLGQPVHPVVFPGGTLGGQAEPLAFRARGFDVTPGEIEAGAGGAVLESEHDAPRRDPVAFAVGKLDDLSAELGRELGPAPSRDRARSGVGDRLLDLAVGDLDNGHRQRLGGEHRRLEQEEGRDDRSQDAESDQPFAHCVYCSNGPAFGENRSRCVSLHL